MVATHTVLCVARSRRLHFVQGDQRLCASSRARLGQQGLLQEQEQNRRHNFQVRDQLGHREERQRCLLPMLEVKESKRERERERNCLYLFIKLFYLCEPNEIKLKSFRIVMALMRNTTLQLAITWVRLYSKTK